MLLIESEDNKIHIFGRTADGVATHDINYEFEHYFYVDDSMGDKKSIFGNTVSKIEVKNKKHVRFLSDQYDKTYESKVKYENRYIIDTYDDIAEEFKRICYFDIECQMIHEFNVFKALNKITSICCYDNVLKRYMVVVLRNGQENLENKRTDKSTVVFCDTEKELLKMFITYIKDTDPDILMAFNGFNFDYPYIIRRMIKNGINYDSLSRMDTVYINDDNDVKIKGRILLDALPMYRHIEQGEREKYSLDYLSQYEGLGEKLDYDGNLDDLFEKDIWKFIKYNKRDVKLLRLLDEKKKLTYFYDVIRRLAKCQFHDINSNMRVVESFILSYAKNHNLVVPVLKGGKKDKENEGAFVMKPVPKLYSNIAVADAKSLYPSIIRQFNMSPETLVLQKEIDEGKFKKEDLICVGNGCYFRKDKQGIFPEILSFLNDLRDKYKIKRAEVKKNEGMESINYKTYDALQYAVKVLANSIFGVLGNPYFFLFTNEIADSILFVEREFIKYTVDRAKDFNRETIYVDTDSIFAVFSDHKEVSDDMILEFNTLVDKINKSYTQFCNDRNIDKNDYFILQPEKIYKKIFFGKAKKRYAGILVWKDGKYIENPKVSVTGFEVVRSDCPQIFRNFQLAMFKSILETGEKEKADVVLNQFIEDFYTFDPVSVCFPKGIGITFETNKSAVHFKASNNANLYCNAGIKSGDKIKWGYVKKTPKGVPFCDVIAFKEKLYDGWIIDYNKHAEKLITDKIKGIYDCLNWEFKIHLKGGEIDLFG